MKSLYKEKGEPTVYRNGPWPPGWRGRRLRDLLEVLVLDISCSQNLSDAATVSWSGLRLSIFESWQIFLFGPPCIKCVPHVARSNVKKAATSSILQIHMVSCHYYPPSIQSNANEICKHCSLYNYTSTNTAVTKRSSLRSADNDGFVRFLPSKHRDETSKQPFRCKMHAWITKHNGTARGIL